MYELCKLTCKPLITTTSGPSAWDTVTDLGNGQQAGSSTFDFIGDFSEGNSAASNDHSWGIESSGLLLDNRPTGEDIPDSLGCDISYGVGKFFDAVSDIPRAR